MLIFVGLIGIIFLFFAVKIIIRLSYDDIVNFCLYCGNHKGDGFFSRLIIWSTVIDSIKLSDILFGNGILSFDYYTNNYFVENNPHNVFLNIIMDFGILSYLSLLIVIFAKNGISLLIFFPFLIFANSQYLGYDNDLSIYFILVVFLGSFSTSQQKNLYKFKV